MTTTSNWRDLIKIHPAADLFPMMAQDDLRVLGEDIKANGLLHPIQMLSGAVIDGRNRLDAMELVGLTLEFRKRDNQFESQIWVGGKVIGHCRHNTPIDIPDPAAFVVSHNINRRHLTTAQKGELIAKLLKADPTKSDRAIAATVRVDNKTVAAKRAKLEGGEEIPQVEDRAGRDGKIYKQPTKSETAAALADKAKAIRQLIDEADKAEASIADLGEFTPPVATEEDWEDGMLADLDEAARLKVAQAAIAGIRKEALMLGKLAATAHQRVWLQSLQYDLDSFEADWSFGDEPLAASEVDTQGKSGAQEEVSIQEVEETTSVADEPDLGQPEIVIANAIGAAGEVEEPIKEEPAIGATGEEFVAAEPAVAPDDDEEILKKLARTKWVGPAKREQLGISEEEVERLLAAGLLRRHSTTPANVGLAT